MATERNMQLILKALGVNSEGWQAKDLAAPVKNLCLDSRLVKPGDVFVALSGFNVHGMDYAYQAKRAGAVAVLTEPAKADRAGFVRRQKPLGIPVVEVADLGGLLGELASEFYGHPSRQLSITAITGTNGKTSVAWLLMHALEQLGVRAGYIGTLGIGDVGHLESAANTTPSAIDIQKKLSEMVANGFQHVSIEVSSHALDQHRFKGTQVATAIFTNLSRDHLDYHKTMKAYAAAKFSLFSEFDLEASVINADDACAQQWLNTNQLKGQVMTYSAQNESVDFGASEIELVAAGITFKLHHGGQTLAFSTALLGHFNVQNLLSVIAVLSHMGHKLESIKTVVASLQPVPGRMNRLDDDSSGSILVVDYAHTPDALEQVLKALRQHTQRQLWCVFGCGGNRDKGKRAMMGAIAERFADVVVLTDDNPRFEAAAQITAEIEFGMKSKPHVINNRKHAIAYAVDKCEAGDVILIAGKGHESTQEVNGELHKFNDMEVAKNLMQVAV